MGLSEKVKNMGTYSKLDYFNEYLARKNEYKRIRLITPDDKSNELDGRV